MAAGTLELRHIVDVDGQLVGIDAAVTDAATLLKRARLPGDRRLALVRHGKRTPIGPEDGIILREDEVLFFETSPRSFSVHPSTSSAIRMAA